MSNCLEFLIPDTRAFLDRCRLAVNSGEELQGLAAAAGVLSHKAGMVFVLFNNCHLGYAIMNATEMVDLVRGG